MFSVILCSSNRGMFDKAAQHYSQTLGNEPHEVIGLADTGRPAEAYNQGLARARGDLLLFSHGYVEAISSDFRQRLLGHLRVYDLVGIAGATRLCNAYWAGLGAPYVYGQVVRPTPDQRSADVVIYSTAARALGGIVALDGMFMCAKRPVVEAIRFDQETFDGACHYDIDFSFRASLTGFKLAVCSDLFLMHGSQTVFDQEWMRYAERFEAKHATNLAPMRPRPYRPTDRSGSTRDN